MLSPKTARAAPESAPANRSPRIPPFSAIVALTLSINERFADARIVPDLARAAPGALPPDALSDCRLFADKLVSGGVNLFADVLFADTLFADTLSAAVRSDFALGRGSVCGRDSSNASRPSASLNIITSVYTIADDTASPRLNSDDSNSPIYIAGMYRSDAASSAMPKGKLPNGPSDIPYIAASSNDAIFLTATSAAESLLSLISSDPLLRAPSVYFSIIRLYNDFVAMSIPSFTQAYILCGRPASTPLCGS